MDFFEHQEKARKQTHLLVFYFFLAIVGIILAVYAVFTGLSLMGSEGSSSRDFDIWNPQLLLATSAGTSAAIFLASAYKTMQLNDGGKVIAQELGGRLLDVHSTDFHERRLLNLVEEMAIASGIPVPEVYIMDSEDSINAFAAGKTTSDAVIGVTRGCMKMLSRDELQGVIAHEFSHILNGDMRLNMRLIGLLFGILFLTLIGEVILRSTYYSGNRGRDRDSGGGALALFIVGISLILIGYIGTFFANLIKASISRQREFLADASAVQFTRNPDGIAGALKKIGALSQGSNISHPMARDASHLFFGSALKGFFATHPPLSERIKRLMPHWNGNFGQEPSRSIREQDTPISPNDSSKNEARVMLAGDKLEIQISQSEAAESMRSVHVEQVNLGQSILEQMPAHWGEAARNESGAQAVVFALLLSQNDELRSADLSRIRGQVDSTTYQTLTTLNRELNNLHSSVKLALIDLSIPSLRRLSPTEYDIFRQILDGLVASDQVVDLFEYTLQKVVARHLDTYFRVTNPPQIKYRDLKSLSPDVAILLSTLAALSHPKNPEDVERAFAHGAEHISQITGRDLHFQPPENCGLNSIRKAIERFEQSTPIIKRELLLACSNAVLTDGKISSHEAELIRAIADAMGCAIPPFVKTAPQL